MDNPPQDSGMGQPLSEETRATAPPAPVSNLPEEPGVRPSPPFLGDRSGAPLPFTIGKTPEVVEPVIPPEPIPEEKFVPNRIILIAVGVLVVVLIVALWWFFRPKSSPPEQGGPAEPPLIEGPSPTPVIPADVDVPGILSPTVSAVMSPTKTPERTTPTSSQVLRASPTPIPTVAEKPLPEAGSVSQTFFMVISGVGALIAGILLLL